MEPEDGMVLLEFVAKMALSLSLSLDLCKYVIMKMKCGMNGRSDVYRPKGRSW